MNVLLFIDSISLKSLDMFVKNSFTWQRFTENDIVLFLQPGRHCVNQNKLVYIVDTSTRGNKNDKNSLNMEAYVINRESPVKSDPFSSLSIMKVCPCFKQ